MNSWHVSIDILLTFEYNYTQDSARICICILRFLDLCFLLYKVGWSRTGGSGRILYSPQFSDSFLSSVSRYSKLDKENLLMI